MTGAKVNRESVNLVPMPLGLVETDFRVMTLEVDSVLARIKADVSVKILDLLDKRSSLEQ